MKKTLALLATLGVMAMGANSYAVGTLGMENYTSDKAIFAGSFGTLPTGPVNFMLQAAEPANALAEAWTKLNVTLDPGGFFDLGGITVGTLPGNASAKWQLTVWQGGTRPQEAALIGQSAVITQQLGSWAPSDPPLPVVGPAIALTAPIVMVPEPSTIALGLLGLGALLIRRRK